MRKRTAIIVCTAAAVIGLACSPSLIYAMRQRQFDAAKRVVASHGGHLSFDLVDGNYLLDVTGTTDDRIAGMIDTLRELPTGFTLLGPGEGRQFWITIRDSQLSDAGLALLCELDVTFSTLSNCPRLTDASATRLSQFDHTYVTIGRDIPFSQDALERLESSLGNWMYPQTTDPEDGELE